MKKLNVKFALALLLGSVVFVVGAFGLWRFQLGRNAGSLLRRAAAAQEAENFREASRLLTRYLVHRRDDDEQLAELALVRIAITETDDYNQADLKRAYDTAETALRRSPLHHELRRLTVDFLMRVGRSHDAIDHIKLLREDPEQQKDVDLTVNLARCHALLGDRDAAMAELEKILGFDPDSKTFVQDEATVPDAIDAYMLLVAMYHDVDELETVEAILDQAVAVNPDEYKPLLERSRYLRRDTGDEEEMEKRKERSTEDIQAALTLAPEEKQVLLIAAQTAIADKDFETASKYIESGIEIHPDSDVFHMTGSDLERERGNVEEATRWVDRGLQINKNSAHLVLKRAELELTKRDLAAAKRSIDKLRQMRTRQDLVEYLDVRRLMQESSWLEAAKKLEDIRSIFLANSPHLTTQFYVSLGQCYEQLGQWDQVIGAAKEVPTTSTARFAATLMKANAHHQKGQAELAIENYLLVFNMMRKADMRISPVITLTLLSLLNSQQQRISPDDQDWSMCEKVLGYIKKDKNVSDARKVAAQAEFLIARGEEKRAYAGIKIARKKYPDDTAVESLFVRLSTHFGDEIAMADLDDNARNRLLQVQRIVAAGGDNAKDELLALEKGTEQWNGLELRTLWSGLSSVHLGLRNYDDVFRLWTALAEKVPNNLRVCMRMFELAIELQDEKRVAEAQQLIEDRVTLHGNEWKLAEATRLTWLYARGEVNVNQLEDARRLLREVEEKRPNWPRLLRIQARTSLLQDNVEEAVEYLERAVENGEKGMVVIQQLANIYLRLNRLDDARRVLQEVPHSRRSGEVKKLLVILQKDVRISDIEDVVPADATTPNDLFWRGDALARNGFDKQATQTYQKLTDLQPGLPQGWFSRVRFLLNSGQPKAAERAMRDAQQKLPKQVVPITLARCWELAATTGTPSAKRRTAAVRKADKFFQQAMKISPNEKGLLKQVVSFYLSVDRESDAAPILDKILEGAEEYAETTPPLIAWARRAKATILDRGGSFQDYLRAINEIRKNVSEGAILKPTDLLVAAQLTLRRSDTLSQKKMAQEFEALSQTRKLRVNEQLVLGQLYQRVGRNNDAERIFYDLLAKDGSNPQVVSLLIETLLKQSKLDQAQRLVNKLPKNSPNRLRISALMHAEKGAADVAERELLALIPNPLPQDQNALLLNISSLLEEIRRYEMAEKLMRGYVQREPDRVWLLAAYYGRRDNLKMLDKSFSMCKEIMDKSADAAVAVTQIGVAAIRVNLKNIESSKDPKGYFDLVDQWFQIGLEREPNSGPLLLQLAEFEMLRGDTTKAAMMYRRFLENPKLSGQDRALVENNLAYVLAFDKHGAEALHLISNAIEFLGPQAHLLDTRAIAKIALGRHADARRDLTLALDEGESAALRFHLAYAQFMDQNTAAAEEELRQAVKLGLESNGMHPVERKVYDQMVQELGLESLAMHSPAT